MLKSFKKSCGVMNQCFTSGASLCRHFNVELQVVRQAPSSAEVSWFRVWLLSKGSQAALYIASPTKTIKATHVNYIGGKKEEEILNGWTDADSGLKSDHL